MLSPLDSSRRILTLPGQSLHRRALVARAQAWQAMTERDRLHAWITYGERPDAGAETARLECGAGSRNDLDPMRESI